jgi:hypothetical protein
MAVRRHQINSNEPVNDQISLCTKTVYHFYELQYVHSHTERLDSSGWKTPPSRRDPRHLPP